AFGEAEAKKLPVLRSRHRTLRLIDLELELLCDELCNALHHAVTRPFAANVNITVIRVANKAMSPALQLPVEFVEHEVAEQWGRGPPCGALSTPGLPTPSTTTPPFKTPTLSLCAGATA